MLKFNNNHIATGYIKQLLASFNLPTYKVYKKEYLDYKNRYGKEDPRIISSEVKTEDNVYPNHVLYVNYIKNNQIQRYYDGQWHPTTKHYHYNKKELNQTRSLKIKDDIYTSDTHEYLGDYLRFQRDYNNLDLMPLYNCFSDRVCPLIQTSFDVPTYLPKYTTNDKGENEFDDSQNYYDTRQVIIDSTDTKYKIYMFPVKLFEKYTIAMSGQNVEVFCGFYGAYYDDREKLKIIPAITYTRYSTLQFNQPVLYNKLSTENITASEVRAAELAQVERNLKMFIRVPVTNTSTITVLEGDYTAYNKSIFMPEQIWSNSMVDTDLTTDPNYNSTNYYWDDNLRKLVGDTTSKYITEATDVDGNIIKNEVGKQIITIIDSLPTSENGESHPYGLTEIKAVLEPFFKRIMAENTTELEFIYEEQKIVGLNSADPRSSMSITDNIFVVTCEVDASEQNASKSLIEDFYNDFPGFESVLEGNLNATEIKYSFTITAKLPNNYNSEGNLNLKLAIPSTNSESADLLKLDSEGKIESKLVYSIALNEYVGYGKTQSAELAEIAEQNSNEPTQYHARIRTLPEIPNNNGLLGTQEISECRSIESSTLVRIPAYLANGFVALCLDSEKSLNSDSPKSTFLTDYNLNTQVTVDQAYLIQMKEKEELTSLGGTIREITQAIQLSPATSLGSTIRIKLINSSQLAIYCGYTEKTNLSVINQKTGEVVDSIDLTLNDSDTTPVKTWVRFNIDSAGIYNIKADNSIIIYYIETVNKLLTGNSWQSLTNRYITNFEFTGYETALNESGNPILNTDNDEPESYLVQYPEIEDREFNPITTLQLLKHNTGVSHPFADRLLEYLLDNAISHVDDIADNVKRTQKIMSANGHTFVLPGAWDGKMRNIIYDYMIQGHPNGERFSSELNHDILGYVDKDVEKVYTSWKKEVCLDKEGNPIVITDKTTGKPITRLVNKKLATNRPGYPAQNLTDNIDRVLLVADTTEAPIYKTKFVATGTILNADIYSEDEDEDTN